MKFRQGMTILVSDGDMKAMLTEQLCNQFGAMSDLRVAMVRQCEGELFEVRLMPKLGKVVAVPEAQARAAAK